MAEQIEVEIVFDPIFGPQAQKGITDTAARTGKRAGANFNRGFGASTRSLGRALGGIQGQILGIGTALAGAFAVRGIVNAVSEIERIETSLTVLLKSSDLARESLQELQEFAARTPFQLNQIADAASGLLAVGVAQEDIIDNLQVLGDIAAGTGKDLGELTTIFGQIRSEGRLTGERLKQLFERNIPITAALADTLGRAEGEIKNLVSSGAVGFKELEAAFQGLTRDGGLFEGALVKQSQTVGGVLSTLGDNFNLLQVEIGRTFGPAIISVANEFINIFRNFSANIAANGPQLVRTFQSLADIFVVQPAKFWSDIFSGDASRGLSEVNKEIKSLESQLATTEERIANTRGSFLANLLGGRRQALQDFGNITARLTELRAQRDELTASTGNSSAALKAQANAQREATAAQNKALEIEKRQAELREGLGTIGLSRSQIIEQQAAKDIEALRIAREAEAITEEEFNARKLERESLLTGQLTQLRMTEEQRRQQAIAAQNEASINSEKTLSDSLLNTSKRFKSVAGEFRVTSKDIANSLIRGFGSGAANAFASFGRALATGQDALDAFGAALLNAFGGALINLGTGFILQGIAQSLAGFGSGGPLIAAGAALATFGGALQGFGGSVGGAGSGVGATGGGIGAGGGFDDGGGLTSPDLVDQTEEREQPATQVALTVNGDILDSEETGTRIAQILSDSFQNDGIVISNGSFA